MIHCFSGRTVPGCWTAITRKDRGLSFSAEPAYTSAFGTHCADVVHRFGNGGMSSEIRAAMLFFGRNEPPDWWVRLSGYHKYSYKSGPVLNYSVLLSPRGNGKGEKGKDTTTRKRNKMKQRWRWMRGAEKKEVRDGEEKRLPGGRIGVWSRVEERYGGMSRAADSTLWFEVLYEAW